MKKKSIGLVLNNTPSYSETFFVNKINSLIKEGYQVTVFARRNGNVPQHWKVVTPYPLPSNKIIRGLLFISVMTWVFVLAPGAIKVFVKLERDEGRSSKEILENLYINAHLLTKKLDWLHFGFATNAIRRENVAKAIGAKMATSIRGYDVSIYPLKNPGCYDLLWKRVDKVHTISDDLLTIAHTLGLPGDKSFKKITPAIDAARFSIRANINALDKLNIITLARLNWKKGLLYSLHAMNILKANGLFFHYTIVGEGEERENLLFTVHQLGLDGRVSFIGKLDNKKIPEILAAHSIYLQPSVQEGFCNSVLEAQAAGLLCVVSDAEGLSENVLNGKTGWVIPKRNPEAIAEAILNILKLSGEQKKQITYNAIDRVVSEFNLRKQAMQFVEFYSQI